MNSPLIYVDLMASPLGALLLAHCGGYLCALDFQDYELRFRQMLTRRFGNIAMERRSTPDGIHDALEAYMTGDVDAVKDVPIHASGTRFQQQVWKALRDIPAGETWTCSDLALAIGKPEAVLEVAQASARNPVAIIVPCHRLIGNSGELTGYTGGAARKHWLLVHEGAISPDDDDLVPEAGKSNTKGKCASSHAGEGHVDEGSTLKNLKKKIFPRFSI